MLQHCLQNSLQVYAGSRYHCGQFLTKKNSTLMYKDRGGQTGRAVELQRLNALSLSLSPASTKIYFTKCVVPRNVYRRHIDWTGRLYYYYYCYYRQDLAYMLVPVFKKIPPRGSVRVRNIGQCQFSNFRFNSRGRNVLGGEGNGPGGGMSGDMSEEEFPGEMPYIRCSMAERNRK